jgi:hypothetical protein
MYKALAIKVKEDLIVTSFFVRSIISIPFVLRVTLFLRFYSLDILYPLKVSTPIYV